VGGIEVAIALASALGAPLTFFAFLSERKKSRKQERRDETQDAQTLLREVGIAVEMATDTAAHHDELARLSALLWQVEADAPDGVKSPLARVCGRLDSYRSGWVIPRGGDRKVPQSNAVQDLRQAIDRARDAIQRYRNGV
jgi:hypothetical protein